MRRYLDKPVIAKDAPIIFRRPLPTGVTGLSDGGRTVEVEISPDLRVTARTLGCRHLLLSGVYTVDRVDWAQLPSEEMPRTAQDILAAEITSAMRLFTRRNLDPSAWTSSPDALREL